MRFNDIVAVAKRELLVITNYKFLSSHLTL